MNYLGIDWGEKRIGLAFCDELGIAFPLPAAVGPSEKKRLQQIETVIQQRQVHSLVVGYPFNMDGSIGFKCREVDHFIEKIEKCFGLPVHRVDERLSSYSVEQRLKGQKQKKQPSRQSGKIDSQAAALILQDFIETKNLKFLT